MKIEKTRSYLRGLNWYLGDLFMLELKVLVLGFVWYVVQNEGGGVGDGKRVKTSESGKGEGETSSGKLAEQSGKPPSEPPKQDYIHVRARRGQATDSHSLAERVSHFIFLLPWNLLLPPILIIITLKSY